MRSDNETVDYLNKIEYLKDPDGTPKCRLTTSWLRGDHGLFRVDMAIIGPKAEDPQSCLPLSHGQAEGLLETMADAIILLIEKARGKDLVS